jgi:hypothetical protein
MFTMKAGNLEPPITPIFAKRPAIRKISNHKQQATNNIQYPNIKSQTGSGHLGAGSVSLYVCPPCQVPGSETQISQITADCADYFSICEISENLRNLRFCPRRGHGTV